MNYNEFKESVLKHIRENYPEEGYDVSVRKVTKNNGMTLDGLCIFPKGINSTPTIYLEPYYEQYKKGTILADILHKIQMEYNRGMELSPSFLTTEPGYETVRNQVIMRLVNYDKNAEILQECPYIRFHDLAITFRWLAHQDEIGISTALITYKDMARWGIERSRLYQDACRNTPRIFPSKVARLKDMLEDGDILVESADVELYVVTNEQGINGATCILYGNLLDQIGRRLGGNYYLLPSSIHEMMICPDVEPVTRSQLLSLVKEANHMVVTMGEVLSDNIYHYDLEHRILSMIQQESYNS